MCKSCLNSIIRDKFNGLINQGETWLPREKGKYPIHPSVLDAIDIYFDRLAKKAGREESWDSWPDCYDAVKTICQTVAAQWPHPSITNPAEVGYTRTLEHGHADRQTFCKLGSYIGKLLPDLPGDAVETIVTKFREGPKQHFAILTDAEMIKGMFNCTAYSCMHPLSCSKWTEESHPYRVYSARTGWGLACRIGENGKLQSRSVVRPADKEFVRIYGSDASQTGATRGDDPSLRDWLVSQGFRKVDTWEGHQIEKLFSPRHGEDEKYLIGPYIDGDCKQARPIKDDPHSLLVCPEGNYNLDSQEGVTVKRFKYHEGTVLCRDGSWAKPEDTRVCNGSRYPKDQTVFIKRYEEWAYKGNCRLTYNGEWECCGDVSRVHQPDGHLGTPLWTML
jgi:hypothetical protein